jgi:serine/threonine-protein kinase
VAEEVAQRRSQRTEPVSNVTGIDVAEDMRMRGAVVLPAVPGLAIERCLGRGGMGAVYLARTRAGREVALKVIATDHEPSPEALVRFHREIAALSEVRHPHIVRLLDAGAVAGRPYLILERVAGRRLGSLRPRTSVTAVDLTWQLARAIAAVHSHGWIHRDIKAGNAMVGAHGFVTLIDFGLAKHVDDRGDDDCVDSAVAIFEDPRDVTAYGAVVGTPRYLAPEVRAHEPARQASDVYGLGLVLGELLREVRDSTSRALASLVAAMTELDPDARPSALEVMRELEPRLGEPLVIDDAAAIDGATWPSAADRGDTMPLP